MKYFKLILILLILFGLNPVFAQQSGSATSSPIISAYFSPDGGVRDKIIAKINLTKTSIRLAIYSFTSGEIAWALEQAKSRGVDIAIVADGGQSSGKNSEINYLISKGIPVKLLKGKGRGIMHNKFAIFDGKEVVTGSYNWTENAEKNNYENAIFIADPQVAQSYSAEFDRLKNQSGY